LTVIVVGLISTWYFDICHKPVETIDELIGKNLDFAHKIYFKADPDINYKISINDYLNEFDSGIYKKKSILKDSIVQVFTWTFINHKQTIWVGDTKTMKKEIIDAIRYKNSVQF
jgi:hypothetical protein